MTLGKTYHRFWKDPDLFSSKGIWLILSVGVTTPVITPVMGTTSCPGSLGKTVSICWTAKDLGIWSDFFQVWDNLIGSTLVDLCEIWLRDFLRWKLQDDEERFTRTLVLLVPLLALSSKFTFLSAGIHMSDQAIQYNLLYFGYFFLVSACWSYHYPS